MCNEKKVNENNKPTLTISDLIPFEQMKEEFFVEFNERQQKAYSDMLKRHIEQCTFRYKVEM